MIREHDSEPVPGLPEALPPGERILWQGSPAWWSLARHAFHAAKIAIYCAIMVAWRVISDLVDGMAISDAVVGGLWLLPLAALAIGLPTFFGWLYARTTLYTVTNRRVVIRSGVAIPTAFNLPFKVIGAAAMRRYRDGTGDLPLALAGSDRIAYLHLWPNARPWRLARPEPMLRSVPDVARVAETLGQALAAAAGLPSPVRSGKDAAPSAPPGLVKAAA